MPSFPGNPNKYVCQWCRVAHATYGELTKHHEECKAKPTGKWDTSKSPDDQTGTPADFRCPHEACGNSYGSFDSLQTHLPHCPHIKEAREFADHVRFRDDIDGEAARELRNADFERWCTDNGYDDAA